MEVTKQQVLGMGLVVLFLGGVLGIRIRGWMGERSLLVQGESIAWKFQLSEPVRRSGFSCVVNYRGIRMLVTLDKCDESGLDVAKLGDELMLSGEWRESEQYGDSVEIKTIQVNHIVPRKGSYWWWRRQIEELRQKLLSVYRRGLPEPESSLVAGVVIGEQLALPDKLKRALQLTGTTHIVAASGFNVAVIVGIGLVLMGGWSRPKRVVVGMLLIWGYVLLCGASPPVIRAGLMAGVMLLSTWVGREYWSGWVLIMVGLMMIIWQPWLVESVSFQLSMAATAGVIWGGKIPNILPKSVNISIWKQVYITLREAWLTTTAAMIMTAPIALMVFGQVSWWGLIVNPLVLWLIPLLMYLGLGYGFFGLIWFPITQGLGWLLWPTAIVVVRIIEVTAQLPVKPLVLSVNWWMAVGWWFWWLGWWGRKK